MRPLNCAALAEQGRFGMASGMGIAIDRHERPTWGAANFVQAAGKEFLSGPRLSHEHDRLIITRDPFQQSTRPLDPGGLADDRMGNLGLDGPQIGRPSLSRGRVAAGEKSFSSGTSSTHPAALRPMTTQRSAPMPIHSTSRKITG